MFNSYKTLALSQVTFIFSYFISKIGPHLSILSCLNRPNHQRFIQRLYSDPISVSYEFSSSAYVDKCQLPVNSQAQHRIAQLINIQKQSKGHRYEHSGYHRQIPSIYQVVFFLPMLNGQSFSYRFPFDYVLLHN